jgi:hypothetical protein
MHNDKGNPLPHFRTPSTAFPYPTRSPELPPLTQQLAILAILPPLHHAIGNPGPSRQPRLPPSPIRIARAGIPRGPRPCARCRMAALQWRPHHGRGLPTLLAANDGLGGGNVARYSQMVVSGSGGGCTLGLVSVAAVVTKGCDDETPLRFVAPSLLSSAIQWLAAYDMPLYRNQIPGTSAQPGRVRNRDARSVDRGVGS